MYYGFMAVFYFYAGEYWHEIERFIARIIKAAKKAGYYYDHASQWSIKKRGEEGRCYWGYAKSHGKNLP